MSYISLQVSLVRTLSLRWLATDVDLAWVGGKAERAPVTSLGQGWSLQWWSNILDPSPPSLTFTACSPPPPTISTAPLPPPISPAPSLSPTSFSLLPPPTTVVPLDLEVAGSTRSLPRRSVAQVAYGGRGCRASSGGRRRQRSGLEWSQWRRRAWATDGGCGGGARRPRQSPATSSAPLRIHAASTSALFRRRPRPPP